MQCTFLHSQLCICDHDHSYHFSSLIKLQIFWRFHINFLMSILPRNGSKRGFFLLHADGSKSVTKWIPKVQKHQGWIGVDASVLFPALILAIDMGIHNILYGNVSVCAVFVVNLRVRFMETNLTLLLSVDD
jgi:hypothetical protein